MRSLLLLPLLLGTGPLLSDTCPDNTLISGKLNTSGSYCRTDNYRWHLNSSCKCPNTDYKPNLTGKCYAYSTVETQGSTVNPVNTLFKAPFEVYTCFNPD